MLAVVNEEEHRKFIEDVRAKHGIEVAIPEVGTLEFLQVIVEGFREGSEWHVLLASCMMGYLIYHLRDLKDYEQLLELSKEMVVLLQAGNHHHLVEAEAQELRSVLFWGNLREGQWDTRKMEAEARLLCALTGADYKRARIADAVLAHGQWNYGPEWDRYMEAEKS
jgi:hypothetical protein